MAASVAVPTDGLAGANGIDTTRLVDLSFNGGSKPVVIPEGRSVYTDPIEFTAAAHSTITINLYLQKGQMSQNVTRHPGSWITSWLGKGNQLHASTIDGRSTIHRFFITVVESWVPKSTSALVVVGDRITDGKAIAIDGNQRRVYLYKIENILLLISRVGPIVLLHGCKTPVSPTSQYQIKHSRATRCTLVVVVRLWRCATNAILYKLQE